MKFDLPTFQIWVGIVKDIISALAACFAAYIAWTGLTTWKRHLIGQSEYEFIQRFAKVLLKIKYDWLDIRKQIIHDSEREMIKNDQECKKIIIEGLSNNIDETIIVDKLVRINRINSLTKTFNEILPLLLESKIYFQNDLIDEFDPITTLLGVFNKAFRIIFEENDQSEENINISKAILIESEKDKFKQEILHRFGIVEEYLIKKMGAL